MKVFGHIVRRGGLERQIIEGKMERNRGRGRPQTSLLTDLKQWTGGSIVESIRQAENRTGWNALVKTTAECFALTDQERARDSTFIAYVFYKRPNGPVTSLIFDKILARAL